MKPIAQHVTMRLVNDQVIARTPEVRRVVARAILTICQRVPLLAFACVDTHIHFLVALSRKEAGQLSRRIGLSIGRLLALGSPFEPSRYRDVLSVWHLGRALEYVLMQGRRHGLPWEACFESSSFPDLLSMRPLGAFIQGVVARHLPRLRRQDALAWAGWLDLSPHSGPMALLPEAACRAAALASLRGRSPNVVAARRAILAVAEGQAPSTLAVLLGTSERTVFRLAKGEADPTLVQAIRLQLGWMALKARGSSHETAAARQDVTVVAHPRPPR